MKPIRLVIDGINSYMVKQEVDFLDLTERGLFGIFGKTGSGKSTILDSITLSLYGQIPRKTSEYINSDRDRASVEFEFEIGEQGKKERYMVSRRFKKTTSNSTRTDYARLMKENHIGEYEVVEEGKNDVDKKIQEIIGLKYDDFLRSVVLPQGKFSEFLVLNGRARRDMLERIFKLKEYGSNLNEKIQSHKSLVTNDINILNARLGEYPNVDDELKKNIENKLKSLKDSIEKKKDEYEIENKTLASYNEVYSLLQEKNTVKNMIDSLKSDEERIRIEEKLLENHQKAIEIKSPILNKRKIEQDVELLDKDKQKNKVVFEEYDKKYRDIEKYFPIIQVKKDGLIDINILKNDLMIQRDVLKEKKELIDENTSLTKISRINNEEYKKIKDLSDKLSEEMSNIEDRGKFLSTKIEEHIKKGDDRRGIKDIISLCEQIIKLSEDVSQKNKKVESIKIDLDKLNKQKKDLLKKMNMMGLEVMSSKIIDLINEDGLCMCPVCNSSIEHKIEKKKNLDSKDENLDEMNTYLENIDIEIKKLDEDMIRIKTLIDTTNSDVLEKEAEVLNIFSSNIYTRGTSLDEIFLGVETRDDKIKKIHEFVKCIDNKINESSKEIMAYEEERSRLREDYTNKKKLYESSEKKKSEYEKNYMSAELKIKANKDAISKCDYKIGVIMDKIIDDNDKLCYLSDNLQKEMKYIDTIIVESTKDGLNNSFVAIPEKSFVEIDEIKQFVLSIDFLEKKIKEITTYEAYIRNLYEVESRKFEEYKNTYEKAKNELDSINAKIETSIKHLKSFEEEVKASLKKYSFDNEEDVIKSCLDEDRFTYYKKSIEDYKKNMEASIIKLNDIDKKLDNRYVSIEDLEAKKAKCEELEKDIKLLDNEFSNNTYKFKEVCDALERIGKINSDLKVKNTVLSNIKIIEDLFRGNRFVEYLSQLYLKNIVIDASQRLYSITNGRYVLEINEDYQFIISDNFNGGIRRSVDTLSGGEIFLTSLSLALALSSQIQLKGSAPLEFFFLDEGFGTLDGELLSVVMESLERLHSKTLSVGIISHVEEIKERIPKKLIVSMDEKLSSSVVKIVET